MLMFALFLMSIRWLAFTPNGVLSLMEVLIVVGIGNLRMKSKLLSNSGRAEVWDLGNGDIVKSFLDPLMFLKEKFACENFFWLVPPNTLSGNYTPQGNYTSTGKSLSFVMKKLIVLREWLKDKSEEEKKALGLKVMDKLRLLHEKGYCHCDVHVDNVVVDSNNIPYLIDFEHLRCRSKKKFEEDIDCMPHNYICALDGSPRSLATNLGIRRKDL